MIALFCKLPKWLGGGHRWTKSYWKESPLENGFRKRCRRCSAERIVRPRKSTKEGK